MARSVACGPTSKMTTPAVFSGGKRIFGVLSCAVRTPERPCFHGFSSALTFFFGLVHGLGFASVLRDMGVASGTMGVTVPLVGFNLGVEAGQLVVACLLLPAIWRLRNWEPFLRRGIPACSAMVAAAGCYWLAQRIWFI